MRWNQRVRWAMALGVAAVGGARQAVAQAPPAVVAAGRDGFVVRSADSAYQLRVGAYFQSDDRVFLADPQALAANNIVLRRVRPVLQATVYKYFDFRLMPDFGQGRTVLFDAYFEARLLPALALRAGKYKPPLGLERIQSATDLRFAERGLPTNLVPNRDVGVQLSGDLARGVVNYAIGVFDGSLDLGTGDADSTDSKDLDVRVFVQPRGTGLGIGIATSTGNEQGKLAAPSLPTYLTPGQQAVFRYRGDGTAPNTVLAAGRRIRFVPQGTFYAGSFGVMAEYVATTHTVRRAAASARLTHHAWQLAGSWFVTGERAAFRAPAPRRPFDPAAGAWGAFELVARVGALRVDDATFPTFADTAAAIRAERSWGVGVTWHFGRGVKLALDYEHTAFTGGAATGSRGPEHFLVSRFQTAF